jgi:hypothetical protein
MLYSNMQQLIYPQYNDTLFYKFINDNLLFKETGCSYITIIFKIAQFDWTSAMDDFNSCFIPLVSNVQVFFHLWLVQCFSMCVISSITTLKPKTFVHKEFHCCASC